MADRRSHCRRQSGGICSTPFKEWRRETEMARRRGKGEGSVRERSDGRWEVRIDLGRGLDGKRRQKSAFAKTQAEAVQQLRKLGGRAAEGQLLTTTTPTVTRF